MITKEAVSTLKQSEIAALLDRDVKTVQRWHAEGLPRHGEGKGCYYVWAEILPWFMAKMSPNGGDEDTSDKARKLRAEADMAEMDRDLQAGQLMETGAVRQTWSEECANMRARLLSIPSKIAVRLEDGMTLPVREDLIREGIYEALEELSGREGVEDA